jgi:hypothetical protein
VGDGYSALLPDEQEVTQPDAHTVLTFDGPTPVNEVENRIQGALSAVNDL